MFFFFQFVSMLDANWQVEMGKGFAFLNFKFNALITTE